MRQHLKDQQEVTISSFQDRNAHSVLLREHELRKEVENLPLDFLFSSGTIATSRHLASTLPPPFLFQLNFIRSLSLFYVL